jgi:SulP family sulfate permease
MVVTVTNEMALTTASSLEAMGEVTDGTIFALTVLTGLFVLIFGLLKWGKLMRFVSESVMTGFITGAAVLIIMGQLPKLTEYEGEVEGNALVEFVDWLVHFNQWDILSIVVGLTTLAAILLFNKTAARKFSLILALIVGTLLVVLTGWHVLLIGDLVDIPRTIPLPVLPDFSRIAELIVPALSLAILASVVSAGVGQSYPNPDGSMAKPSKDWVGVGAANTISGFFQAIPTTGGLGRTEVNRSAGAKSRWAVIFSALILLLLLATIAGVVEYVPEAALAGMLIYVGYEAINQSRILRDWKTYRAGQVAMVLTFLLTLLIPLHYAVFAGALISLSVGEGRFEEREVPAEFPSNQATVIMVYGPTYFAAVQTLENKLPSVETTENAVIMLDIRGRETSDAAFFAWLERSAKDLRAAGNRLMLVEVHLHVKKQLEETNVIEAVGEDNVFLAQPVLGASIEEALIEANKWLSQGQADASDEV